MLWGTIVNACAVVVGAAIGLLLRLREDVRLTIMQGRLGDHRLESKWGWITVTSDSDCQYRNWRLYW